MQTQKTIQERKIYLTTITGSAVDFLLLVFKFFAGIVGHSAAMLAEAVHSLSDFVVDVIILLFVRIAHKAVYCGPVFGYNI